MYVCIYIYIYIYICLYVYVYVYVYVYIYIYIYICNSVYMFEFSRFKIKGACIPAIETSITTTTTNNNNNKSVYKLCVCVLGLLRVIVLLNVVAE